ncbi:hypothetical protein BDZ88DRAFT_416819 [Geranomyces variabilis]|nr:hypothetical protein BDZ88DRAFT_416819 [Geranomyces variabilis]
MVSFTNDFAIQNHILRGVTISRLSFRFVFFIGKQAHLVRWTVGKQAPLLFLLSPSKHRLSSADDTTAIRPGRTVQLAFKPLFVSAASRALALSSRQVWPFFVAPLSLHRQQATKGPFSLIVIAFQDTRQLRRLSLIKCASSSPANLASLVARSRFITSERQKSHSVLLPNALLRPRRNVWPFGSSPASNQKAPSSRNGALAHHPCPLFLVGSRVPSSYISTHYCRAALRHVLRTLASEKHREE